MEIQNFGWNALTVGFLGTVIFTFWEAWGYYQQKLTIWKGRSAESVSATMFCYMTALFASLFIYGLSIGSIAAMFNGAVLSLFSLPILVGLGKFKGFTVANKILGACLIVVLAAMVLSPYKGEFFISISLISVFFVAAQPFEIIRNRNAGDVEPKLLVAWLVSTGFWVVYAYSIKDIPLMILCPIYLALFAFTLVLVHRFRRPPA